MTRELRLIKDPEWHPSGTTRRIERPPRVQTWIDAFAQRHHYARMQYLEWQQRLGTSRANGLVQDGWLRCKVGSLETIYKRFCEERGMPFELPNTEELAQAQEVLNKRQKDWLLDFAGPPSLVEQKAETSA